MTKGTSQVRRIFLEYYRSDRFQSELMLPQKPNFHHFRFEYFDKGGRFGRLREVVRDKDTLRRAIVNDCPRNAFFSPLKWLDPINVRRKRDDSIKDYMLSSPLYFDVDKNLIPTQTLGAAIENAKRLLDFVRGRSGRNPDWIVFSGSEGFHIYYWKWDDIPKEYSSAEERIVAFINSRRQLLTELRRKGIIVDISVTADPWRIMRIPGTLHGDTCLIAKLFHRLSDFSIEKTMLSRDLISSITHACTEHEA